MSIDICRAEILTHNASNLNSTLLSDNETQYNPHEKSYSKVKNEKAFFPIYAKLWVSIIQKQQSMAVALVIQLYVLISDQYDRYSNILICTTFYQIYYILSQTYIYVNTKEKKHDKLVKVLYHFMVVFTYIKAIFDATPFFVRADHLIEPIVIVWRILNIIPYFIEYIPIRKCCVFVAMLVFLSVLVINALFVNKMFIISLVAIALCSFDLLYGTLFFIFIVHSQSFLLDKNTNLKKDKEGPRIKQHSSHYILNKFPRKFSNDSYMKKEFSQHTTALPGNSIIDQDTSLNSIMDSLAKEKKIIKGRERQTLS